MSPATNASRHALSAAPNGRQPAKMQLIPGDLTKSINPVADKPISALPVPTASTSLVDWTFGLRSTDHVPRGGRSDGLATTA